MKEKGTERWRTEHESPSGGPGSRNDVSPHGRSSEYGANFRDSSMQGGGGYGSNAHDQGDDAGLFHWIKRSTCLQ